MPTNTAPVYYSPKSGEHYPIETPKWCAESGQPLMISDLPGIKRDEIDQDQKSIWRYAASLPCSVDRPISLLEGLTPLLPAPWLAPHTHLKMESQNPTGSFKDRGASVMLSILRQQGIDHILEDSSGNGGASIAGYAAAGGMKSTILVPSYTQAGKTVQMRAYGGTVQLVPGTRQDTANAAIDLSREIFYASHNWQALFLQGTKTLAYELWEDLNYAAPDNIIIPTGAGSNVLGCDIGFGELLRAGEIDKRPKLFAAQPANCCPIHTCFASGNDTIDGYEAKPTLAEGTSIAQPIRTTEVLAAIRRSNGGTAAVSEAEIVEAFKALTHHGTYVEPTSAVAVAAVKQLIANKQIDPNETSVILLTGSGLKATHMIAEITGVSL